MSAEGKKVFSDPIHGHSLLFKITDTPQFQRLRNIKQLGGTYFVYPGASHNRFEHSIGVCHLAGKLVEALKSRQPKLKITSQKVLRVQFSFLSLDLGHGPFSRLFNGIFNRDTPDVFTLFAVVDCCLFRQQSEKKPEDKSEKQTEEWKVFNDPIHGPIELHPLLVKIIDTPQFQRLRNIKQLGGAYFVYPGASHNRFEHSIGVCHLAGQLAEALRSRQPDLNITPKDVLCVQIAGLCHDLGHGPFSHLFDGMFFPEACKRKGQTEEWKHETATEKMFDHLVKSNKLEEEMQKYGINMQNDQVFIKEMIVGPPNTSKEKDKENQWPYEGRKEDKSFLYEIVSNKLNGIDVDKFDYLARDCYHLGIRNNFDHRRFLKFARVCEVKELKSNHICTRDKMVDDMYDLFNTRYILHRRVCYHRVTNIIQIMIRDAFLLADEHLQFEGSGGQSFTLSEAKNDMDVYTQLTDTVFEKILHSKDPKLENAKKVLQRIISRDLYKLLGKKTGGKDENENKALISEWKATLTQNLPEGLEPEDFEVTDITYDYGMKEQNPFDSIYFYAKDDTEENTVAFILPEEKRPKLVTRDFSEKVIRFYFKRTDPTSLESAQKHFDERMNKQVKPEPNPAE